jgi:hypothetical protein
MLDAPYHHAQKSMSAVGMSYLQYRLLLKAISHLPYCSTVQYRMSHMVSLDVTATTS